MGIELELTESLKIMGIVKLIISNFNETRSEEVGENEKEQETNNKCLECRKEFESIEELRVHEKNCFICEQCNNWYESREDLEDHRRRRHKEYNCDQCDNWYGYDSKEELDDHRKRTHSKECEEKLECRKEMEQQNREEHRSELVCDLCNKKFKNENELVKHWEIDHEVHIYPCIHLGCRIKYICQEIWKEHMKDKHGIGFNCPQCNEYCLFEEHLEEHIEDEHMELEEYMEPSGFQCVECKEFFESVDDVIDHENEGECDQCGKWLGCEKNMQIHKQKEHEYIE